jgi:hypothetical protein
MARADRDAAVAAAKRQRMTIGEWLGEAIRRQVSHERAEAEPQTGEIIAPGQALVIPTQHHGDIGLNDLVTAMDLAERLGKLRDDGKPPRRITSAIQRRLQSLV